MENIDVDKILIKNFARFTCGSVSNEEQYWIVGLPEYLPLDWLTKYVSA